MLGLSLLRPRPLYAPSAFRLFVTSITYKNPDLDTIRDTGEEADGKRVGGKARVADAHRSCSTGFSDGRRHHCGPHNPVFVSEVGLCRPSALIRTLVEDDDL